MIGRSVSVRAAFAILAVLGLLAGCGGSAGSGANDRVVTVLSARHYDGDRLLYEQFTKRTGIRVQEVKGTAEELVERLRRDGEKAAGDVLIAVDGGVLEYAKRSGVLQPWRSETVERQVPAQWRDPERYWTAVAKRARVIVYDKERVNPAGLSTYEDLTDDRWRGKVLVRSSTSAYNQSLLASFIALHGEASAERWASGIVRNLARSPEGGDRAQAEAIAAEGGDVAIMNAYYIGQLIASPQADEAEAASRLGVIFPDQDGSGTHVNISGIGLTRHANRDGALKLIEYLTSREGQTLLAKTSFEFPVNEEAELPKVLQSWGSFKAQPIDMADLYANGERAAAIFARTGWQ